MKRRQIAFTLAEVLITLVIIGVIAALTVPALIQSTQKQEYVTALKKAYSVFSQAAQQIIAQEGSPASSCATCKDGWAYSSEHAIDMFAKHLNIVKICGKNAGCFPQRKGGFTHTALKDSGRGTNLETAAAVYTDRNFLLQDGMQVSLNIQSPECKNHWGNNLSQNLCGYINIDVNGAKGPNIIGRDLFRFILTDKGLEIFQYSPSACTSTDMNSNFSCAYNVLTEGAMNY